MPADPKSILQPTEPPISHEEWAANTNAFHVCWADHKLMYEIMEDTAGPSRTRMANMVQILLYKIALDLTSGFDGSYISCNELLEKLDAWFEKLEQTFMRQKNYELTLWMLGELTEHVTQLKCGHLSPKGKHDTYTQALSKYQMSLANGWGRADGKLIGIFANLTTEQDTFVLPVGSFCSQATHIKDIQKQSEEKERQIAEKALPAAADSPEQPPKLLALFIRLPVESIFSLVTYLFIACRMSSLFAYLLRRSAPIEPQIKTRSKQSNDQLVQMAKLLLHQSTKHKNIIEEIELGPEQKELLEQATPGNFKSPEKQKELRLQDFYSQANKSATWQSKIVPPHLSRIQLAKRDALSFWRLCKPRSRIDELLIRINPPPPKKNNSP